MTTPSSSPAAGGPERRAPGAWRRYLRPELATVVMLLAAFVIGAQLSPYFLDGAFLLDSTSLYMEVGVMALSMTLIIIAGQIDLSVASAMALVSCATATMHVAGLPMGLAILAGLALGIVLGLFNGLMVTRLGLPALTVTLGTLALYRGIAQILMGDHSILSFPDWFVGIDNIFFFGIIPLPLVLFLVLAVVFGLLLHRTVMGRWIYAVGTNEGAAWFSGIPVARVKLLIFALSGLMSAMGALLMTSRLGVARFNIGMGRELDVITAVVLGGTDIMGGRGSVFGTVVALFLVGILRTGMGVANIKVEKQLTVIGALLILSIILSNFSARSRRQ